MDQFYKDIIVGKYGFYGDKVLPGDTRHLAFCNMMLQGWNMLSIARMGGHTSIRTQMHYHAHLDYFAESWVYNLSQRYRLDRINRAATIPTFSVRKVLAKQELFQPADFEQRYEVDHGFCTYNPSLCETGDCRFCEHYLFSPGTESHEEAIRWLTNSSNELQRRMREQIDYLKEISKHIYYDVFTLEVQKTGQERLLNAANQLRRIMEQKAMGDSYLEE
ncbi:hypothetical protein BP422_13845 [Brevibacillus formosus]|uniref:Integrase n=1 Tax=Brevibacillus formosus TaxID=54913 RepID=A0A220MHH4_9BACL|nr:hypothetical protein BP422_13845 [Brevibacillus formosus]